MLYASVTINYYTGICNDGANDQAYCLFLTAQFWTSIDKLKNMEEDRNKIREPFDSEKTPGPPQRIDPQEKDKRAPGSEEEKPGGPANSQREEKENPRPRGEDKDKEKNLNEDKENEKTV